MPLPDPAQATLEDHAMSRKAAQRRSIERLSIASKRAEIDCEQLEKQFAIVAFIEAVEAGLIVDMAGQALIEMADETRGQEKIVRDHVGRQMREIAEHEGLLAFAARGLHQAEARRPIMRMAPQTALETPPLHDIGSQTAVEKDFRQVDESGLKRGRGGDNRRKHLDAERDMGDGTPCERMAGRQQNQRDDEAEITPL